MYKITFALLVSIFLTTNVAAENWSNWRGPNQTGMAKGDNYPTSWNASKNISWKVKLPGTGGSTPAVWGNHIFLTCSNDKQNVAVCYDRKGEQLWRSEIGKSRAGKHRKATGSNSSPATDGEHVFVYFKSGDLACLDFKGEIVWQKNLQKEITKDTLWWDLGTSPVLTKKSVVIACMQSDNSYLVAYDKVSGKQRWKQDRNLNAPVEAEHSYSTPMVINDGKRETIIVLGADHVTAHKAENGKEIWRVGGLNPTKQKFFRSISSPVVSGNLVIAPYARGKSLTAIKLGGKGNVTKSHVAWFDDKKHSADVPTPATDGKKVYICKDKGTLVCMEAKSGKILWTTKVARGKSAFSASPILAGKYIYLTRENGTTYVINTESKDHEVVSENKMNEMIVATPVFVDGNILIRTRENLYCIRQEKKE